MAELTDILKATNVKLKNVQREKKDLKQELKRLESDEEKLSDIAVAIMGLKETKRRMKKRDYDPGKYDTAYFYCWSIKEDDIEHSNRPKLYEECPECGEKNPVLMSYRIYDSSDIDSWTKEAFSVCICGNYNEIKKVTKTERFL